MITTNYDNPMVLAQMADTYSPDTSESPGAQWLLSIASDAGDLMPRIRDGEERNDVIDELADGGVPVYTAELWAVFVDLGAYTEDVTELADPAKGMEHMAQVALYMIAERLLNAIAEEQEAEGDDHE